MTITSTERGKRMAKKATNREVYRGTVYRFVTVDDTVIGIRLMLMNPESIVDLATNAGTLAGMTVNGPIIDCRIEPNWVPTGYKLGDFDSIESCTEQLTRDGLIPQLRKGAL